MRMNTSPRSEVPKELKSRWFFFVPGLVGAAVLVAVALTNPFRDGGAVQGGETKKAVPRVVLADTYNAVTRVHFTNSAVHKGSPKRKPVTRRFQADVTYWLMDAKYYDRGELSIGNPTLVEFVRKLGSKDLPASEPTTLPAMAYGLARAVLEHHPIIQKVEIRLIHFSKGLETKDESEDNHVVNLVLQR
jgi:hypothetical protein